MTLEEAKNILEKEGFKLHKASSKLASFSETFERYESPEIVEAIHVLFENNYNVSMESRLFNERKRRLKKEYGNNHIKGAFSSRKKVEHCGEPLPVSPSPQSLLDEQAKKIKHFDELSASRNKIIVKQSKKISKLRKVIRDKDAVLSDVSEELRLSKVREEKLTKVCQKYLKEIDELKDKVGHAEQRMNDAYASCHDMKKKIDARDAEISGLKEELADAKKMIGMVRNASKEYHDWGVAANEFIKKLSSLYLQAHNENRLDIGMLMRCKDYKTYGFPATINQETKEEINDIASGKECKKPRIPTPEEPKNNGSFEAFKERLIENYNKRAAAFGCVGRKKGNGILDQMEAKVDLGKGKDYTSHIIFIPNDNPVSKKPIEDDIMEGCKEMLRLNIKLMRDLFDE